MSTINYVLEAICVIWFLVHIYSGILGLLLILLKFIVGMTTGISHIILSLLCWLYEKITGRTPMSILKVMNWIDSFTSEVDRIIHVIRRGY